eukprot:CAMPEP_0174266232 /NCGR_PEP_ID=MMETSP0439-20130205/29482_1 /TAXON_ID=0 /ORGANISM="Stereomyxa ramosa, Strain Chinc5" /LENGTH=82 /DNA_ID=CAMNT_0015353079 /DNA_START=133 /DNA_END=378 /DNA_ORIENTATION=+
MLSQEELDFSEQPLEMEENVDDFEEALKVGSKQKRKISAVSSSNTLIEDNILMEGAVRIRASKKRSFEEAYIALTDKSLWIR